MRNQPVQKIDYRGCTIEIFPVHDAEDPRQWGNEYGQMWCFHKRYRLGDHKDNPYHQSDFSSWSEMREQIHQDHDVVFISSLYMYEHSGITISMSPFSSRWDSGQIGFVVVTRERVLNKQPEWKYITGKRVQQVKQWVKEEVQLYDSYLRGEVYSYIAEGPEGEHIDSCAGFYGYDKWDDNGLFGMAKPAIDYYLKKQKTTYFKRLKELIRNNVPLQNRESEIHKPTILKYAL